MRKEREKWGRDGGGSEGVEGVASLETELGFV